MKGKILAYDASTQTGLITGADGQRYPFPAGEWQSPGTPRTGGNVDFTLHDGEARSVYADAAGGGSSKKIPAALLAFFLGVFGVHKFYLGYTRQGLIMLLVFLFGIVLLGIPSVVIGIIAFVEFILYLIKPEEEFEQTYVIGRRPWF